MAFCSGLATRLLTGSEMPAQENVFPPDLQSSIDRSTAERPHSIDPQRGCAVRSAAKRKADGGRRMAVFHVGHPNFIRSIGRDTTRGTSADGCRLKADGWLVKQILPPLRFSLSQDAHQRAARMQ